MRTRSRAAALVLGLFLAACSSGTTASTQHGSLTRGRGVGPGLAGVGTLPRPASAWPQSGYDARRSSATTATGPQTAHVRWTRDLGGDATPGPVLAADGTVLAASQSGVLHDLDASTGKDVWTYDGDGGYGSDLSTSPAVVAGGTILWPGPADTLFALSPAGTLLWREKFAGQVLSPAVAGRDRVYVSDLAGHLTALQVTGSTHRKLWTIDVGDTDYASPTVGQDGTIYTVSDKDLVAVRDLGAKAAVRWRFHSSKMIEVSNAVGPDGTVLLGTNNDRQYGIAPSGKVRWAINIDDYSYSSSIVRPDGTGYFGDNAGEMRIVDTRSGRVTHTITPLGKGKEHIWTAPAVDAKGDVYWGSGKGNIYGYDADGKQLFHLDAGAGINSYPAIGGDGTLYLGTTAGTLYAIGS